MHADRIGDALLVDGVAAGKGLRKRARPVQLVGSGDSRQGHVFFVQGGLDVRWVPVFGGWFFFRFGSHCLCSGVVVRCGALHTQLNIMSTQLTIFFIGVLLVVATHLHLFLRNYMFYVYKHIVIDSDNRSTGCRYLVVAR